MYKKNLALYPAAEDSMKSVFVVSCLCFLPLLELFVLLGALPYVFLQWELFRRAGSCLCITEGKKALKGACPRLELSQKLAGCLVLAGCSSSHLYHSLFLQGRPDPREVPKESWGIMQEPPFFCAGADKNLSLALPSDFWRQYFMQNHFLRRTV